MFVPRDSRARGWSFGGLLPAALAAAVLLGLGTPACGKREGAAPRPVVVLSTAAVAAAPRPVAAEPTCGVAGLPECPLQHWMDHHLNGPLSRDDYPALVRSFRDLAAAAPREFGGWRPWAEGGALAAGKLDGQGVRRACEGCHQGYRQRYRATMRDRPRPAADPP